MTDPFTFWCCFYCDGELIVTSIIKKQVNVKCKCGATGFIWDGRLCLHEKEKDSGKKYREKTDERPRKNRHS